MIRSIFSKRVLYKRIFKPSVAALRWCKGSGIELGAAAHNPFNLPGAINVAPTDDFEMYKQAQVDMCGLYADVDIWGEAHNIPLPTSQYDYVLSSHVVEHLPDPISAFWEWTRLVRPGGTIFMIVPKPGAHPPDAVRKLSSPYDILEAFVERWDVQTHPFQEQGPRGHYWVMTPGILLEAVQMAHLPWKLVERQDTDDKVGNGWTLVFRVDK